jgi:hypothetical protein
MDGLLQRMSAEIPHKAARIAFLINNYSLCVNTASERKVNASDAAPFETALQNNVDAYISTELDAHFRTLVHWVNVTEAAALDAARSKGMNVAGPDGAPVLPPDAPIPANQPEVEAVLRDFNASWRQGTKEMSSAVATYFSKTSSQTAMGILKRVMSAFINKYERFQNLLQRAFPANTALLSQVVALQTIYYEIKQQGRSFE